MLLFGLKGDELVSIEDIDVVAWGARCGCFCPNPACREPLIAKNRDFEGRKQRRYFAHASGADCVGASESALHRLAKHILEVEMAVMAPPVRLTRSDAHDGLTLLKEAQLLEFDEIRVEKASDGLRPDVSAAAGDAGYMIEILVTHAVDDRKRQQARSRDWTMLEVDLSDLVQTDFTADIVRKRLLEGTEKKVWIRHALAERTKRRLEELAAQLQGGAPCPAGLGTIAPFDDEVPHSRTYKESPCSDCPCCFGLEGNSLLCLYDARIFCAGDVVDGKDYSRAVEPRFFAAYRESARIVAEQHARAAAIREVEEKIRHTRFRVARSSASDPALWGAINTERLQQELWSLSSQILAEYKRHDGRRPIRYAVHLLARPPLDGDVTVIATFLVGPDHIRQIETGTVPRGMNTGQGFIYPVAGGFSMRLLTAESSVAFDF